MSNGQAPTGGITGINGEFYAGGQFLPSTQLPKQSRRSPQYCGPKRVQLDRYTYADRRDGFASIYAAIAGTYVDDRGGILSPCIPYLDYIGDRNPIVRHLGATLGDLDTLIARFNAGERWIAA